MKRNDTSIAAIGGSAIPLHHEHLYVEMVRETVRLDLYPKYYEATVDFVFANHGEARDVLMGFPERGEGMDGDPPQAGQFRSFRTTVDGTPLRARRVKAGGSRDVYQAYWTKEVHFPKNGKRLVQVQYRSDYGAGIDGARAAYDFTGGNWRGKVTESRLIVVGHPHAPALPIAVLNGKPVSLATHGHRREITWRNWEAQATFLLQERFTH